MAQSKYEAKDINTIIFGFLSAIGTSILEWRSFNPTITFLSFDLNIYLERFIAINPAINFEINIKKGNKYFPIFSWWYL